MFRSLRLNNPRASLFRRTLRSLFIQTESTPNENALKFIPGRKLLTQPQEFTHQNAAFSPLATQLLRMPSVKSVYLGTDFLTVTKDADQPWAILKPEIYAAVMDFLSSGQPLVTDEPMHDPNAVLESDSEVVAMIKELLTSRIRPAIQDDGGDVEFVSFEQGIVKLKMKGSCRGCSSSAVTLKSGIEKMMQHYIPEVESVEQVLDEAEQIANDAFNKLESKLESTQQ